MPPEDRDRPNLFSSHVEAWDKDEEFFKGLNDEYDDESATVGGLRRRRRQAANITDEPIKTVSLIEKDGVLLWCDDIPEGTPSKLDIGPRRRRLRRRAGLPPAARAIDPVGGRFAGEDPARGDDVRQGVLCSLAAADQAGLAGAVRGFTANSHQ